MSPHHFGKKETAIGRLARLIPPAVILVVLAGCRSAPRGSVTTSLRVMSYNIQYGGGGANLDRIADAIADAAPDIVALQEVDVHWSDRSQYVDQAFELGRRLRMEVRFARIYQLAPPDSTRPAREFGVTLLTRRPILSWRNAPLTRLSTQEANPTPKQMPGLLEVIVDVDGRPIRLYNTHLDYRADPSVRRQQVAEMVAYLGEREIPTIAFGDFNAPPDASELQPLLGRLHDVWPPAQGAGFTFPSDKPVKRIDYILISPQFEVKRATIPDTRASDHRPIVAELVFDRR